MNKQLRLQVKPYKQYRVQPDRFPRQHLKHTGPQKKGTAKTKIAVNTNTRQAKNKVKETVAKTSKTADATARQARSKVIKELLRQRLQLRRLQGKQGHSLIRKKEL
ncbi:MAG: hypothetical protein WA364_29250 [Candidatus Nitrosopolaris sp.]